MMVIVITVTTVVVDDRGYNIGRSDVSVIIMVVVRKVDDDDGRYWMKSVDDDCVRLLTHSSRA